MGVFSIAKPGEVDAIHHRVAFVVAVVAVVAVLWLVLLGMDGPFRSFGIYCSAINKRRWIIIGGGCRLHSISVLTPAFIHGLYNVWGNRPSRRQHLRNARFYWLWFDMIGDLGSELVSNWFRFGLLTTAILNSSQRGYQQTNLSKVPSPLLVKIVSARRPC